MPAADPADQQAARTIESTLREAVQRGERPPVELSWFQALPKRIRRSGRLLETAQNEAQVLIDQLRTEWSRARRIEQERAERLAKAQSLPRNLECLRMPDTKAWNGLGRRKSRCRAFEGVGRAFLARQRLATPNPAPQPVESLETVPNVAPTRPPTPPGLRAALYNTPGLLNSAMTKENYGCNSPIPVFAPSLPQSAPDTTAIPTQRPAYPHSPLPGELTVFGKDIDPDAVYIVSRGRHAWAPFANRPLRDVAVDVAIVEEHWPGMLGYLAELFFPGGVSRYDQALEPAGLEILVEFVRGWYEITTSGF
ncbi:hypothetical protein RhiJN_20248 [Ceratobasidium sp. AG-Ba]|nr:hypothetical protein RhiJN_20248 [Ceratobasidium sp. AG-Ba]